MRISEALSIVAAFAVTQAAAQPSADASTGTEIESRIVGNEVNSLLCITPNNGKCGLYVTYTNGQRRETVKFQSGGLLCSVVMLRKHTNGAGFWADVNVIGRAGLNVGFNPTGKQMSLGDAGITVTDQKYLNSRCKSEFGWDGVDTSKSSLAFWGNLGTKLY